jgi:hypothetical protein
MMDRRTLSEVIELSVERQAVTQSRFREGRYRPFADL